MKKVMPAAIIAAIVMFSSCQKKVIEDEPRNRVNNDPVLPQQVQLRCPILEDPGKTALARKNTTSTNVPVLLLLDFNGHPVSNTNWNTVFNSGNPFYAQGVPESTLSETARNNIVKWVSEDFSAFGVKITRNENDYQNAPPDRRMRCIITHSLGQIFGAYGGIAYLSSLVWGDNTPCFVFIDYLSFHDKYIAEATSHELGHTFGLYHQATFLSPCV